MIAAEFGRARGGCCGGGGGGWLCTTLEPLKNCSGSLGLGGMSGGRTSGEPCDGEEPVAMPDRLGLRERNEVADGVNGAGTALAAPLGAVFSFKIDLRALALSFSAGGGELAGIGGGVGGAGDG